MPTNPVVLITGATGEFGPYVARAFAEAGARLAPTARKLEQAQALAAELGLGDDRALPYSVDVTQAASVAGWVAAIMEKWGRIDVLVNIAGGYKPGKPVADMEESRAGFHVQPERPLGLPHLPGRHPAHAGPGRRQASSISAPRPACRPAARAPATPSARPPCCA